MWSSSKFAGLNQVDGPVYPSLFLHVNGIRMAAGLRSIIFLQKRKIFWILRIPINAISLKVRQNLKHPLKAITKDKSYIRGYLYSAALHRYFILSGPNMA